jgi:hypothetical protein
MVGLEIRQPMTSAPPLRKSRMAKMLIERLVRRTLIAVILAAAPEASILHEWVVDKNAPAGCS